MSDLGRQPVPTPRNPNPDMGAATEKLAAAVEGLSRNLAAQTVVLEKLTRVLMGRVM